MQESKKTLCVQKRLKLESEHIDFLKGTLSEIIIDDSVILRYENFCQQRLTPINFNDKKQPVKWIISIFCSHFY